MDANQRNKDNNQVDNGANEKWTAGAKGKTTDGPMDHTYPQGAAQQQGKQDGSEMGARQSGTAPGGGEALPGGSMQTQQTGGSGAQQGITDSHQRAMEQRSGAYGELEQPVGRQAASAGRNDGNYQRDTGVHESNDAAGGLPRSPGNTGATESPRTTHLTGAQNSADLHRNDAGVHESNDLGGGYPRSPGGANKLAADEKMDDDTGFSNPGR